MENVQNVSQPLAVKPRKARIDELDVLRALAFLGVVMQHSLGVYIRNGGIPISESSMLGMLFNLVKFAVPCFVFLTGVTLFYNYYEKVNYLSFLRKRTLEILVPYVLWCMIYEWYVNGIPSFSADWWVQFGKNIVLGREFYHLWYIPMIFQFYLLYPLLLGLFKGVRKLVKTQAAFWIVMALFTAAYAWLMWFTIYQIGGGKVHPHNWLEKSLLRFLDRDFLWWSFYFYLGAVAGYAMPKWRTFVQRSMQWNWVFFVLTFLWVGFELMRSVVSTKHVDLNFSTSLKPSMFFYGVSEIVLLYALGLSMAARPTWLLKLYQFISRYSYGAYLAHALVLNYCIRAVGHYAPNHNNIEKTFLCFGLCAIVTTVGVWVISKIPFVGRFFIGSTGKRKKAAPSSNTAISA